MPGISSTGRKGQVLTYWYLVNDPGGGGDLFLVDGQADLGLSIAQLIEHAAGAWWFS